MGSDGYGCCCYYNSSGSSPPEELPRTDSVLNSMEITDEGANEPVEYIPFSQREKIMSFARSVQHRVAKVKVPLIG